MISPTPRELLRGGDTSLREASLALADELSKGRNSLLISMNGPAGKMIMELRLYDPDLFSSETRDTAALKYLHDSTAPDGQWADQAVHGFVGAMLKSNAAPQGIAEQKPQESSASSSFLAEGPATQDRPAVAAPVWVSPTDRNPDLDGRLWAVLTERRQNGKRTGFITAYEYYHFTDGWATEETILFWLDSPLHPLPSVPRE